MVEWDASRHYVPASLSWFQRDFEISFQRIKGFEFDKCDLTTSPRPVRVRSNVLEVPVAFQTLPRNSPHLLHGNKFLTRNRSDLDESDFSGPLVHNSHPS
jgi:hypothetical protein